jgi:predicted RNase H-like HicB family nuclease
MKRRDLIAKLVYVYPAMFTKNADSTYTVTFMDLPGCISEGKDLSNAMYMAERALTQWLSFLRDEKERIPAASDIQSMSAGS